MLFFLSLLLWGLAGVSAFVFFYGRVILDFRNTQLKFALILISLVFFPGIFLTAGWRTGWSIWIAVPVLILLVAVRVELRQRHLWRSHHGSPPVETRNYGTRLHRPFTTLDLAVRRYEVRDPVESGRRLRVAHISDLHVHAGIPRAHYRAVMDHVAELAPDLLFITGDFLTQRKSLSLLGDVLAEIPAECDAYGVLGNHDFWEGGDEVADVIRAQGIRLLGNGWQRLDPPGGVVVAGCEDPWGEGVWKAPPVEDGDHLLVLTHTADNIYRLAAAHPLAVFAGHYHGGQAVLPVWGPVIIPSRMGRRFTHGHFVIDRTHLFVTTGVGAAFPPVRIYCQPEVLVVDFV